MIPLLRYSAIGLSKIIMGIYVQHFPVGIMAYSELSEYYQDNSRPIDAGVLQEC